MVCCVFFFKQKTAYEMRISDWSSDVCSSDLRGARSQRHVAVLALRQLFALRAQELEAGDELDARLGGVDDVVDEPSLGGDVGVAEPLRVLVDELGALGDEIVGSSQPLAADDHPRPLRAPHRMLDRGPAQAEVPADPL